MKTTKIGRKLFNHRAQLARETSSRRFKPLLQEFMEFAIIFSALFSQFIAMFRNMSATSSGCSRSWEFEAYHTQWVAMKVAATADSAIN